MLNVYSYGIDLAESLNYTGITVTHLTDAVRIKALRMLGGPDKPLSYPIIERVLLDELFPKYPPGPITIDYTYEKSVAEGLEAKLHPAFLNPNTDDYRKWKRVEPVIFNKSSKLAMKQNAALFLQKGWFRWPAAGSGATPEVDWLIAETKKQMMREAGVPGKGPEPVMLFPKPKGHNNDMAISLELNLYGLRIYIPHLQAGAFSTEPVVASADSNADYFDELRSRRARQAQDLQATIRKAIGPYAQITDVRIDGENVDASGNVGDQYY